MHRESTTTNMAKYVLSLISNSVTDANRTYIRGVIGEDTCDGMFSQILEIICDQCSEGVTSLDEAISRISVEYNGLNLGAFYGEFSHWEAFVRFCLAERHLPRTSLDIVFAMVEFIRNSDFDVAVYTMSQSVLNHLVVTGKVPSYKDLSAELIEYIERFSEEELAGEIPANVLLKDIFNKRI